MLLLALACHPAPDPTDPTTPPTGSSGATGDTGGPTTEPAPALSFRRDPSGTGFAAIVSGTSSAPTFVVDHGAVGAAEPDGDGFAAPVDPDRTGRLAVTATLGDGTVLQRTALVLGAVAEPWDQPELLDAPVNTGGWEDSVQVSADGSWLFLEYLPIAIDCLIGAAPTDPVCTTVVGPVAAPERPDFPGADRVHGGVLENGCPSLGLPANLPFSTPPAALYGFHRQPDGTYAEPFALVWDGADGCWSSFGPDVFEIDGDDATLVYAFDSPTDGVGPALFSDQVHLGERHTFGTFSAPGGVITLDRGDVPLGPPGVQAGNPDAWRADDGSVALFWDDEGGSEDLLGATGPELGVTGWSPTVTLPISSADAESQPFFDGDTLLFRRGLTIFGAGWDGGPLDASGSWSAPEVVLDGDPTAAGPGEVLGVGEPSIAVVDGHRELFFVVVQFADDGTLDLDVGRVRERPSVHQRSRR